MKIIFMGTPNFAVPILERISSKHEVLLVVTQPDQYHKRKRTYLSTPVKEWALANGLEVFQPEKIKQGVDKLLSYDVDLIVTAAYGQFIPKVILEHPKYRSINVHGSLLPKYRGGAPIQRAIMNGEEKTGISIIYMESKMDAGDILQMAEIPILDIDNQDTMFEKLSYLGRDLILDVIDDLEKGQVKPIKQNKDEVSFAYNLTKADELIDFNKTAREVFNQIRGLNSNPGAYFTIDGIDIKVYNSNVSSKITSVKPGVIVGINKDSFDISCQDHTVISITELQLPSKNKIRAIDFLNGSGRKLIEINKEIQK